MKINLPNYLVVEGNIGAGKTTLATMLSNENYSRVILEQFADNPFLHKFYENPKQHALTVELFFLTERAAQLQAAFTNDIFMQCTVADYFFLKTLLFAAKTLNDEEMRLFRRIFDVFQNQMPRPALILYLHRPVEVLLRNIAQRGRSYEQQISAEYLQKIQDTYFDFFKKETTIPIVVLDLGAMDFVENEAFYEHICRVAEKKYPPGLNFAN